MADMKLDAEFRTITRRKVRQLRAKGLVPVVVYGKKQEPIHLQVNAKSFDRMLKTGGSTQLVEVNVDNGKSQNILIREIQRDPVTHNLLHADFYAVDMTEKQLVAIPVVSVNAPDEMAAGLMVLQALESVEVEALPSDIPASIEVDIASLTMESAITVADLPAVNGVEYVTEQEESVFTMIVTRAGESELDEDEALEGELEEGAEPEVVGRGKSDEDEDE